MASLLNIVLMSIDIVVLMPSIPGNVFILVVNILDWIKNKKHSTTDRLIFGISAVNLLHGLLKVNRNVFLLLKTDNSNTGMFQKASSVLLLTSLSSSLWFCTWLCIHFCLKIVRFKQRFYIYLQRTIPKKLPCLLLLSFLGSISVAVPIAWDVVDGTTRNVSLVTSNQEAKLLFMLRHRSIYSQPIYTMYCCVAFTLFSSSAGNIIVSLFNHMKHMQENIEGSRRPNLEAHISAAKTVTSLLVLNAVFFICLIIGIFKGGASYWLQCSSLLNSIFHNISALVLINGNRKLQNALSGAVICYLSP
ncbi:taste receptor type 2 member 40-like [Spea bombifrons]|uniref:taste receptor type 2 member 40-like n=1 Tax=Spea bombifrons TaxID=233779 RepID=UPI00234B2D22|nr:taste receptor type 2 member 40-like [Spea bombifrons]